MSAPRPGQPLVRRYLRGEHVSWAQACRVISADGDGVLAWLPEGAGFAHRVAAGGEPVRAAPIAEFGAAELVLGQWRSTSALILMPTGAAHSVWWIFVGGAFTGWYVNLEARSPVWSTPTGFGVDVVDHELDIVVAPDRRWQWKDEQDLATVTGLPGYWDEAGSERIRAEGIRVIRCVEAGTFPFDDTWCGFRPDGSWPLPILPDLGLPLPTLPDLGVPRQQD
jgi:hypothetical protein